MEVGFSCPKLKASQVSQTSTEKHGGEHGVFGTSESRSSSRGLGWLGLFPHCPNAVPADRPPHATPSSATYHHQASAPAALV